MNAHQPEEDLKKRSFLSIVSLFFQSGYSAVLGLVANLIITILLSPSVFGVYITVLSLISFLNYFSDVGLAGALIQKKELSEDDLATTFTFQQLLTLILIIIGFFFSPFIKSFYNLPQSGVYLYWALLISFFISSMKTIPSVFLERKIKFQKIVLVQIVESTVFYATVSILAFMGFGLNSFTVAVLLRSVVGLVLIYSLSFWLPKIYISLSSLKELATFGLPFQATSIMGLFKDDLIVLYLGKVVGFEGLGYIGWAKKWADAPIRMITDNLSRIIFPLIARFQEQKERVKMLAEKILYYQTLLLAPVAVGIALVMSPLIYIIPNYTKWLPALPLFYIFIASSLIVSFSAPFMNLFNALGKVKIAFSFMLFFTILTWILTPTLTKSFGYYGFPYTHILVSTSFVIVLFYARNLLKFRIFAPLYKSLLATAIMGFVVFELEKFFVPTKINLLLEIAVGASIYFISLLIIFKLNLFTEIKSFYAKE